MRYIRIRIWAEVTYMPVSLFKMKEVGLQQWQGGWQARVDSLSICRWERGRFKVSRRSGGTKACTMVTQIIQNWPSLSLDVTARSNLSNYQAKTEVLVWRNNHQKLFPRKLMSDEFLSKDIFIFGKIDTPTVTILFSVYLISRCWYLLLLLLLLF